MTEFYFLRHGQSLGNKEHRFLGHTDLDLSELGYKQAELAKDFFKVIPIDLIYSSDLMRAYNTAKPIADMKNIPIIKNKNLREIYAGDWENRTVENLWEEYYDGFFCWRNDIGNAKCPNGESFSDLQNRFFSEVSKIAKENNGKRILVATHAAAIRTLLCKVKGYTLDEAKNIPWVPNASVTSIIFEDDGGYFIKAEGFDAYLDGYTSTVSSKM